MINLKDTTKEFCKMFGIDLNAPTKARLVLVRNGEIIKDEIVTINVTEQYYTAGRLRFKKGNEDGVLLGFTSGKNVAKWNKQFNESINYLYKV